MIPIFGDGAKAAKLTQEAAERLAKESADRAAKEAAKRTGKVTKLQRIHTDETYLKDPEAKASLEYWRTRPDQEIIDSLKPGSKKPLTVKSDGRIYDGNTRTKALQERGCDIDSLPRVELPKNPLDDLFID